MWILCSAGHHPSPSTLLCTLKVRPNGRVNVCDYTPYGLLVAWASYGYWWHCGNIHRRATESEASLWVIVVLPQI